MMGSLRALSKSRAVVLPGPGSRSGPSSQAQVAQAAASPRNGAQPRSNQTRNLAVVRRIRPPLPAPAPYSLLPRRPGGRGHLLRQPPGVQVIVGVVVPAGPDELRRRGLVAIN